MNTHQVFQLFEIEYIRYLSGNVDTGILSTVGVVIYELIFYNEAKASKLSFGAAGNKLSLRMNF